MSNKKVSVITATFKNPDYVDPCEGCPDKERVELLEKERDILKGAFEKLAYLVDCKKCTLETKCPMYATQDGCTKKLKSHYLKEMK